MNRGEKLGNEVGVLSDPPYKAKLEYIETLFNVNGHDDSEVNFAENGGGYDCGIEWDEFEVGDSPEDIYRRADKYSCCGDKLDPDYMICRSCGEHC